MNKRRFFTLTIVIFAAFTLTVYSSKLPVVHGQTSDSSWRLTIGGLVENPLNLTFDDIKAMPSSSEYAVLYCVNDPLTPLSLGTWTGVKLSYLLQQANVSSDATKVAFFAPDGFSTDQFVGAAMQDNIILAYQKDNVSLDGQLRLVVPFEWGYKWISNPTQIQLVNFDFLGTEESLGYADDGVGATQQAPIKAPLPVSTPQLTHKQQTQPENATPSPTQSPLPTLSVTASPTPIPSPNPTTIAQTNSPSSSPTPIPYLSSSPKQQLAIEPNSGPNNTQGSPAPILLTAALVIAVVAVSSLVYFRRTKKIETGSG